MDVMANVTMDTAVQALIDALDQRIRLIVTETLGQWDCSNIVDTAVEAALDKYDPTEAFGFNDAVEKVIDDHDNDPTEHGNFDDAVHGLIDDHDFSDVITREVSEQVNEIKSEIMSAIGERLRKAFDD
jgi:hypothetical protein